MKRLFFFSFIFLYITNIFAEKEFAILPVKQQNSLWCWAAACEMLFNAYKINIDQYDIALWAVSSENKTNDMYGNQKQCNKILEHFGNIYTSYNSMSLYETTLYHEITAGKPIIAGIGLSDNSIGHVVLIIGYSGPGYNDIGDVIINDPSTELREAWPYDLFVKLESKGKVAWQWNETLRMIDLPKEPIPLGIGTNHAVILFKDNSTTEFTQSQSLSYYAHKNGDSPISWSWKLSFPHSEGDAVVSSWNNTISQKDQTWNIPNFTLPSTHDWFYQTDGKIVGKIEVECLDPDIHRDHFIVEYIPNDLYPGVLSYENYTLTNSQPDVRAHQLLTIQNDQFLSGAEISFKSGECIKLNGEISIESGSEVKMVIDQSLR